MPYSIALAGKGGTGKTTVAGMLIKYLTSKGKAPILAVDADCNANLNEVLGLEVTDTLGNAREEMKKGKVPSGMTKDVFMSMKLEQAIAEAQGYVEGIKISDMDTLDNNGLDRKLITCRGADFYLKQIFIHGFFHADPHPGNIFILPENVICLVDFGMVGSVDRQTREDFVELVDGIVHRKEGDVCQILLRLAMWETEPNIRDLEKDVANFIGYHLYKPLKEIQINKLFQDLLDIASRYGLGIPADLFLMMKALGTIEGVALSLDPDFDMIARAKPFIESVKLARFSPRRIAGDTYRFASDLIAFTKQFPRDLLEISRLIRHRKLTITMEHQGLERILATHDQISNRISFSIIIAALIIGSALIVISGTPPIVYGISLIGIIGFLAAAVMGVWLLVAIIRKGRL
jgi:ubiquinone biosynthesis protein